MTLRVLRIALIWPSLDMQEKSRFRPDPPNVMSVLVARFLPRIGIGKKKGEWIRRLLCRNFFVGEVYVNAVSFLVCTDSVEVDKPTDNDGYY